MPLTKVTGTLSLFELDLEKDYKFLQASQHLVISQILLFVSQPRLAYL